MAHGLRVGKDRLCLSSQPSQQSDFFVTYVCLHAESLARVPC